MGHFLLLYDYVADVVERLVMGGAIGDPPHGAVIVFDVASADEVEEFARSDPYVAGGIVIARRVEPWAVVS